MFRGVRAIALAVVLLGSIAARGNADSQAGCCGGDCNLDGRVTISDLITLVNIALNGFSAGFSCGCLPACLDPSSTACPVVAPTLIDAVNNALRGCPIGSGPPDAPNQPPFQLVSRDEHCGDQTAAGILVSVNPEYDLTLAVRSEINLPSTIPLTIRLAYHGGKLTCYPAFAAPPGSTLPDIAEQVGAVMDMQFLTQGGVFAEQFPVEIKGRAGSVSFSYGTTPDNLQGTYRPDLPGYEDVQVGFFGNFGGDATNGGVVQSGIPPGHVSLLIPIGYWTTLN